MMMMATRYAEEREEMGEKGKRKRTGRRKRAFMFGLCLYVIRDETGRKARYEKQTEQFSFFFFQFQFR